METEAKNCEGRVYLKEDLRRILETNPLKCIPNNRSVLFYNENTDWDLLEKSVLIILEHIKIEKLQREASLIAMNKNNKRD